MASLNEKQSKTNWGLVFFVIVAGLILLSNAFNYLTWQIWDLGLYIVIAIVLTNFAYNFLRKKIWFYKLSQILMFSLVFALISHTVFAITQPGYIKIKDNNLTPYEIYVRDMIFTTNYYSEEISQKKVITNIRENEFNIIDSTSMDYHFKVHPSRDSKEPISLNHNVSNSVLNINLGSSNYPSSPLEMLLGQNPTIVLGTPHISTNFDINTENTGVLNVKLEKQSVDEFRGLVKGGELNIKLSESSLPRSKFLLTVRGGNVNISLPRSVSHKIKYKNKDGGSFLVDDSKISGKGNYEIISGDKENSCLIEIVIDRGEVNVTNH